MKPFYLPVLAAVTLIFSCTGRKTGIDCTIERVSALSVEQCLAMGESLDSLSMPRTFQDGKLVTSDLKWWCSGFFPGTCWYSYMLSGDARVRDLAWQKTELMLDVDSYFTQHDIGFQVMCSVAMAYRNTADKRCLDAIRRAAGLLASRYNANVGAIRSWDSPKYSCPVIIDNMMNLELLTFASREFGVPEWAEMAVSHADRTMENHFRADGSSYHVVDYDPHDGRIIKKQTHQGYSDESSWSRGQAWGLYGFTMMYRETGLERYLKQAEKIAHYLLPLLADDPVPAWDLSAPAPSSTQKDASAAAIMASAFLELGRLTNDRELSEECIRQAGDIILELAGPVYLAGKGELGGFLLKHCTGFYSRGSEVDVPLTYADYYFLEAICRYRGLI